VFVGDESMIDNKLVPVLEVGSDGRRKTVWVDIGRFFNHGDYDAQRYAPPLKPLQRGGVASLKRRRDALLARIKDDMLVAGASPAEHVRRAFRERDADLMYVYEKFLTKDNQHQIIGNVLSSVRTLRSMGCESLPEAMTYEHLLVNQMVWAAVDHVNQSLFANPDDMYFREALGWVAFENLEVAPQITSLVKDNGVTDMRVILDLLPEIKASHPSLSGGVL